MHHKVVTSRPVNGDQQTTDANAGQTTDQQTTDANAGQTTDQQTTDTNAANQQTAEQPQAPAEYQVVTKDVVKVRDGASTDAKELGLLKEQVTLTAYGTEGDWTIVSYSAGTNGRAYIKTENLQTVGTVKAIQSNRCAYNHRKQHGGLKVSVFLIYIANGCCKE